MGTNPAAYGLSMFPPMTHMGIGAGISTPYGLLLPPATRVAAYVRSGGVDDLDEQDISARILPDLASALRHCRANRGDVIVILPGHAENVTDATMLDNLQPGVKIIGVGQGTDMPTFTFTDTSGQWTLDQANVTISGVKFDMTGANGITKAILATAAHNQVIGCDFDVADSDSLHAAIVLEVGTGGHHFRFVGNNLYGVATAGVTDGLKVVAAVTNLRVVGNTMLASATAANGLIRVTAAATELLIAHNVIANTETSSTACIAFADTACTGICAYNTLSTLNDGTASAQGVTFGTAALVRAFENYSSDEPKLSGILAPAAAT